METPAVPKLHLRDIRLLMSFGESRKQTVLPKNATMYSVLAESVMEDIRRLREELQDYSAKAKIAG